MNRRGSAFLIMMGLLPLVLISLCCVLAAGVLLLEWKKTHELCQISLVQLQTEMGQTLEQLIALNPAAKTLRAERAAAQHALKVAVATGNLPAIGAANAYLASVVARQTALRAKQEALKTQGQMKATRKFFEYSNKLRNRKGVGRWPSTSLPRLAVDLRPAFSMSPDHIPKKNFEKIQAVRSKWIIKPSRLYPEWIQRFFPELQTLNGSCSATLQQKGLKWKSVLGEGRS